MSAITNDFAYLDRNFAGADNMPRYQQKSVSAEESTDNSTGTEDKDMALFGDDGFGFDDFLDIINPLQHLPIISTLYREFTGDEISPGSRMIGGGVFGGGVGLAVSVVNTVIEVETGKDVGAHVMAMFTGNEEGDDGSVLATTGTALPPTQSASASDAEVMAVLQEKSTSPSIIKASFSDTNEAAKLTSTAAFEGKPKLQMDLEWKGNAPDLHKSIQNIQNSQEKGLSEDQLSMVLSSFKVGKVNKTSTPVVGAQPSTLIDDAQNAQRAATVTKSYEKQAQSLNKQDLLISDSFDYLNKLI